MNLWAKLKARAEAGRPVRVALIGAGKFGSMFLAQAPRTPGLHVAGIADLAPARARDALARVGIRRQLARRLAFRQISAVARLIRRRYASLAADKCSSR